MSCWDRLPAQFQLDAQQLTGVRNKSPAMSEPEAHGERVQRILRTHYNAINEHLGNIYTSKFQDQSFFEFMLRIMFTHTSGFEYPSIPWDLIAPESQAELLMRADEAVCLFLVTAISTKLWPNRDTWRDNELQSLLDTYFTEMLKAGLPSDPVTRSLLGANRNENEQELKQDKELRQERDARERMYEHSERKKAGTVATEMETEKTKLVSDRGPELDYDREVEEAASDLEKTALDDDAGGKRVELDEVDEESENDEKSDEGENNEKKREERKRKDDEETPVIHDCPFCGKMCDILDALESESHIRKRHGEDGT